MDEVKDVKGTLFPELMKILLEDVDQFHEALSKLPDYVEQSVKEGEQRLIDTLQAIKKSINNIPLDLEAGIEAKKRELAEDAEKLSASFEKGKGELQGIKESALSSISVAIVGLSDQAAKLNQESANTITNATKKSLTEFNESIDLLISKLNKSLSDSQHEAFNDFKQTAIKSLAEMNSAYNAEYKKIQDLQQKTDATLNKFESVIDAAFTHSSKKLQTSLLAMIGGNIVITVICFIAFYFFTK